MAEMPGLMAFEAPPPPQPDYGLDATGDFDLASVDASHITAMQQQLAEDPQGVLDSARKFWDANLTESDLREALATTRAYIEQPDRGALALESLSALESAPTMPSGWSFEGYDPAKIPIFPNDKKFQTVADGAAYVANFIGARLANALKPKPPFLTHNSARTFVYNSEVLDATIGVFSDFGNGLSHSRYITKQLRNTSLDHLLYVGDVYYCGTSKEFKEYVAPEIEDFLTGNTPSGKKVNVMMLNSNHEMFSKGYSYFSYIKYRLQKGAPQCQEGSYFALRFGKVFQIIAIDTDYFGQYRLTDSAQIGWLKQRLAEGREVGAINILVTANEPYEYGKMETTALYDDLLPYSHLFDLWFWGNTHYCGLFDRTATLPVATCVGHGGYPYKLAEQKLDQNLYQAPCPATPLFLEARTRYHGTNLRPDLGNNGYVVMKLDSANQKIELDYMDWMKTRRYHAVLGRDATGKVGVLKGEEF